MNILATNVKNLRNRAGLTLEKLAEISSVSKSTLSDIENGKGKNPKAETLSKIAKSLNVSLDDLQGIELNNEYYLTDVTEAFEVIFSQTNLTLDGERLTKRARKHLESMVKMAIESTRGIQLSSK